MKSTYYFTHDFNARNDPKLQNILMIHGLAGLGAYWCIIEQLYEQGGSIELAAIKSIAFTLHATNELIESVIYDFDLFDYDADEFWSSSLKKRLAKREETKKLLSEAGKKGMESRWKNNNSITTLLPTDNEVITIKENKIKENKINNNIYKGDAKKVYKVIFGITDVKITEEEYQSLVRRFGQKTTMSMITKLDNYLASTGRKYKSDYRAILNWVVKEFEKDYGNKNWRSNIATDKPSAEQRYEGVKKLVNQQLESDSV